MNYRLLALDLDGTLLDDNLQIRHDSIDAIKRVRAQGKLLVRERLDLLLDPGTPFLEFSALAACEDENVLPAVVEMHRHSCFFTEANQRRRRSGDAITVEAVDVHASAKEGPGDFILTLKNVEYVLQLEVREAEARWR